MHKADKFKLNIYFDTMKRGSDITNLSTEIEIQRRALQEMKDNKYPLDDDVTIKRLYKWFSIDYDQQNRLIKDFSLNEKIVSNARRASGFYAIATLGMDITAMQTWELYGLRDEQEKYFQQMKSQLGFDRQRNWSEEAKTGRLLILFVSAQIDIANAFGFKILDGCTPKYTSRKKDAPHRDRLAKPKTSELEH